MASRRKAAPRRKAARTNKAARREPHEKSWWDLWPGLYKREIGAFDQKGVTYQVALKKKGFLVLESDWPIDGREALSLRIGFSTLHPFSRPIIAAFEESFDRHQDPLGKALCLLTQEFHQWHSRQLVADFIGERLPQFIGALDARRQGRLEDAAKLEEQSADPLMPYFVKASENDSVVLFDGQMSVPEEDHGLMDIAMWPRELNEGRSFEAVLQSIATTDGRKIGSTFKLPTNPPHGRMVAGRWIRMDPPLTEDPAALMGEIEKKLATLKVLQPQVQQLEKVADDPFSITGIVFTEEVEYGRSGADWLFLAGRREFVEGALGAPQASLVSGQRAGKREIFSRLPVASKLHKKTALLVGCGAIGSFVAVELARAGVGHLHLIDSGVVEPGNSLRWALGRSAWGVRKSVALADFLLLNYPWTDVTPHHVRLGSAIADAARLPDDLGSFTAPLTHLRNLIREADLVIDATASTEVQEALAFNCRDLGKPYIVGYATEGLAGGVVARFQSNPVACWVCLQEHWDDDDEGAETIPKLRVDKTGIVTPVGCNQSTFTGGSFDLQEVSLEIIRSAVGFLTNGAYEPGDWSVAILELRDDSRRRVLPTWTALPLAPHPRCCGGGR